MKLFENLKRIAKILESTSNDWAICGGIAACLYRDKPRFTGDIDIILSDSPETPARKAAEKIVSELGYKPALGFISGTRRKASDGPALVVGRENDAGNYVGIDFLLPVMPWIAASVERAQSNMIDYGFAKLPTITPEDLIIAKLFAIEDSPDRPYDLDDIKSILLQTKELDREYILRKIEEFNLPVPESVKV